MDAPSIRGVLFQSIWERLGALVKAGALSPEELEVRLEAEDLALLDQKPEARAWYPLNSSTRMVELLVDKLGGDEEGLAVEFGREATRRALNRGHFRIPIDEGANCAELAGEILLMLPEQLVNFGRWSLSGPSILEFRIDVLEAATIPNHLRYAIQSGFQTLVRHVSNSGIEVSSIRPTSDHIEYRAGCGETGSRKPSGERDSNRNSGSQTRMR